MPEIHVVQRRAEHLKSAAEALRLVHERDGYPMVWPEDPVAWLSPGRSLDGWVALLDGAVVGHVLLVEGDVVEHAAEVAVAASVAVAQLAGVSRLFVAPAARGGGVAAALLDRALRASAERGRRLALDVLDDGGPAVRLYERLGWARVTSGPAGWTRPDGERPQAAAYLSPG
ncbi:GNAT family N-acetyltransferase [Antribacter gilvus]|uniref:GNAT family N-acetyltransferase n=1 Tax=Antribacter gilvus TaxID=2304675 RepID=UPI00197FB289|nr:GNAT family N-acetyltransferase [Antribacter gilvus]